VPHPEHDKKDIKNMREGGTMARSRVLDRGVAVLETAQCIDAKK
jgi:hypothetical protein